jgi:prepilin-type N-terminal cleavage/methylation domain-containing protein
MVGAAVPPRSTAGFTLVELAIAIVVAGVLGGVAIMALANNREKAAEYADAQTIANIQKCVRVHQAYNNLKVGDALVQGSLIGPNLCMEFAPIAQTSGAVFAYGASVPASGSMYTTISGPTNAAEINTRAGRLSGEAP